MTTQAMAPALPVHRTGSLWQMMLIWLLVPVVLVLVAWAVFEVSYADRIFPGVQAVGVELSGRDQSQALEIGRGHGGTQVTFL